ncbi:MAG: helix-turn-helix transcriptional regulator [Armatimonadetes bacterium]|nr:helix-turn-helix transcriptional regulator [Anaerolineae bacterium]
MPTLTPDDTLLGLLAVQPRHGYQLLECFQRADQLGRLWTMSTSQLYAVLKRLEREAYITGHEVVSDSAPSRTEYHLTPSGQARLQRWLYDTPLSPSIRRIRVEFLSRLFIAQQLQLPTTDIVRRQREGCERKHAELLVERTQAVPGIDQLALDFQINQLEAVVQWLERCALLNDSP